MISKSSLKNRSKCRRRKPSSIRRNRNNKILPKSKNKKNKKRKKQKRLKISMLKNMKNWKMKKNIVINLS